MKLTKIKKKLTLAGKSFLTKLKKKRTAIKRKRTISKKKACKKLISPVKKKIVKRKPTKKRVLKSKQNKVQKSNMNGIPNFKKNILSDYSKILIKQKELEYGIASQQKILKVPGQPKQQKDNARKLIKLYKLLLSENKTHAAQLKKLM